MRVPPTRLTPTPPTGLILLAVALAVAALAPPADARVPSSDVAASLARAKDFLYSRQKRGHWDAIAPDPVFVNDNAATGAQWGGTTSLVVYALLAAGESPQDPKLAPAIEFLTGADIRGTYALALRLQVYLLLPPSKEIKAAARRDAERLLAMTQNRGSAKGMHDYTANGRGYSHSRSQYAVLGLWAAEQMGIEIPARYWATAEAGWLSHQHESGGWTYMGFQDVRMEPTAGMTAAGVATLFITNDYVHSAAGVDCRGGNARNAPIDAGLDWLVKHFDTVASDTRYVRDFPFMTLYAVERVGVAGGLKYFGPHDWYDVGATWLLKSQKPDGSFAAPAGRMDRMTGDLVDTAFATLFLARGRAPIAINKLDYTADAKSPAAWNQRPREIANVVRWIARQFEFDLKWQVVNLTVPVEDLLDAPILYIAGSQALTLTDAQAQKLKAYAEAGGLIVANADCASPAFAASFRKLGEKLFGYEFRELPADHVLYRGPFPAAKWKAKPQVLGLSNGARELMLLIPTGDPARLWQTRAVLGREDAWQLMANVYRYTFERRADLGFKGDARLIAADAAAPRTRSISVARIAYAGNWDPEPGAWRRLAATMANDHGVDVRVTPVKLGEGKLTGHKIAHLTGTAKTTFNPAAIAELRAYVEAGGTLVIEPTGGSADFADSAEALLRETFPNDRPRTIPENDPIYRPGGAPTTIAYRAYARRNLVGAASAGRLAAIDVNGRPGVVVSREDLSVGLVGSHVDGVVGYAPETALRLMTGVVLSAMPKPPATAPAATRTSPAVPR